MKPLLILGLAAGLASAARAHDMTGDFVMPPMAETATFSHVWLDQMEGRASGGQVDFRWQGQAWFGNERDKIWLKSDGFLKRSGRIEEGRHELLYTRAISTWADLQAGVRTDLDSGTGRAWAALGVQGTAPMFLEYSATTYLSDQGHAAARLSVSYDLPITQSLILRPEIEANFYSKADPGRGIGPGLSGIDAGVRLRYEINRKVAPYIGIAYGEKFGETARIARRAGENPGVVQFVFGLRSWF